MPAAIEAGRRTRLARRATGRAARGPAEPRRRTRVARWYGRLPKRRAIPALLHSPRHGRVEQPLRPLEQLRGDAPAAVVTGRRQCVLAAFLAVVDEVQVQRRRTVAAARAALGA